MGRPSKYTKRPIFLLRSRIGPLTQTELALKIDVPFSTIQAAESGRRGGQAVSASLRQKIRFHIGCLWDEPTQQWLFDLRLLRNGVRAGDRFVPITPELYAEYKHIVAGPLTAHDREQDSLFFESWLAELLQRLQDRNWTLFTSRFSAFVEGCCRDFRLGDPVEFFDKASPDDGLLLAMGDVVNKPKTPASAKSAVREMIKPMRKALAVFGPDSEKGKAIGEMLSALEPIANSVPTQTKSKAGVKPGKKSLPKNA